MDKTIVHRNYSDYQLIAIGIELVHKIIGLHDSSPELVSTNALLWKSYKLSLEWNETFLDAYIPRPEMEGVNNG